MPKLTKQQLAEQMKVIATRRAKWYEAFLNGPHLAMVKLLKQNGRYNHYLSLSEQELEEQPDRLPNGDINFAKHAALSRKKVTVPDPNLSPERLLKFYEAQRKYLDEYYSIMKAAAKDQFNTAAQKGGKDPEKNWTLEQYILQCMLDYADGMQSASLYRDKDPEQFGNFRYAFRGLYDGIIKGDGDVSREEVEKAAALYPVGRVMRNMSRMQVAAECYEKRFNDNVRIKLDRNNKQKCMVDEELLRSEQARFRRYSTAFLRALQARDAYQPSENDPVKNTLFTSEEAYNSAVEPGAKLKQDLKIFEDEIKKIGTGFVLKKVDADITRLESFLKEMDYKRHWYSSSSGESTKLKASVRNLLTGLREYRDGPGMRGEPIDQATRDKLKGLYDAVHTDAVAYRNLSLRKHITPGATRMGRRLQSAMDLESISDTASGGSLFAFMEAAVPGNFYSSDLLEKVRAGKTDKDLMEQQIAEEETLEEMKDENYVDPLESAIRDFKNVYRVTGAESREYTEMDQAIEDLEKLKEGFFKDNKPLTEADRAEIAEGYRKVIEKGEAFLRKLEKRILKEGYEDFEGYEEGRRQCVTAILDLAGQDLAGIQKVNSPEEGRRTLRRTLREARRPQANLNDPSKVKTASGQASTRLPLRVKNSEGQVEEGFFTENSVFGELDDKLDNAVEKWKKQYGFGDKDTLGELARRMRHGGRDRLRGLISNEQFKALRNNPENLQKAIRYPSIFGSIFRDYLYGMDQKRKEELLAAGEKGEKTRADAIKMFQDLYRVYGMHRTIELNLNIKTDARMDIRNVGMYRVAGIMGMKSLIAEAKPFELVTNGQKRSGVFMKKAEGIDINKIADTPEVLGIAEAGNVDAAITNDVKLQLLDLQALDFICGNKDRHSGNLLLKTGVVDGKYKITGVIGIDNDMSFGNVNKTDGDYQEKMVSPENMGAIRRSTAQKILDMTPEKLRLSIQDMGLSEQEIQNCINRLKTLQTHIGFSMQYDINYLSRGKLAIMDDEEIARHGVRDFMLQPMIVDRQEVNKYMNLNYFDRLAYTYYGDIKPAVQENDFIKDDAKIVYTDVSLQGEAQPDFRSRMVPVESLAALKQNMEKIQEAIRTREEKGIAGKGKGVLDWAKYSGELLTERLTGLMKKYDALGVKELSSADAKELFRLCSQYRLSGNAFLDGMISESPENQKTGLELREILSGIRPELKEIVKPIRRLSMHELGSRVGHGLKDQKEIRNGKLHGLKEKNPEIVKNEKHSRSLSMDETGKNQGFLPG